MRTKKAVILLMENTTFRLRTKPIVVNTHQDMTNQPRSALERLPTWVICVPLTIQWLALAAKYRSATLPSVANPHITSGGLVGEGKLEYFQGMGATARASTAAYVAVNTCNAYTLAQLQQLMAESRLAFPIIAKPNLGLCGYGVRLINNVLELNDYLHNFPAHEVVILQEYLAYDGEAGVFYARQPDEVKGRIIGMTFRYYPQVVGDGKKTIAQLITANPRAKRLFIAPQHQCQYSVQYIPNQGEVVRLATIGSTRVGGLYKDSSQYITPELTAAIDAIAKDMPDFYFGRFDVRFADLSSLCHGQRFKIMEVNGAGSEAIEAWDPQTTLLSAFAIIFAKQRLLFAIADKNRHKGHTPIGLIELARLHFRQRKLITLYPPSN